MTDHPRTKLEGRVVDAAEAALARQQFVSPIDVLVGMGWLHQSAVDRWRQGRVEYLERVVQANLHKLSTAMRMLRRWAAARGLEPSDATYVARTRERRPLRFSASGDPAIERAYRTHWRSPRLSESNRRRVDERQSRPPDLLVIASINPWTCLRCGRDAERGEMLFMEGPGPLCLACAGLDHLVFLPRGDAALTRRARKASPLAAVVVRFSRARRRYEREGLLVEQDALRAAEGAGRGDSGPGPGRQ